MSAKREGAGRVSPERFEVVNARTREATSVILRPYLAGEASIGETLVVLEGVAAGILSSLFDKEVDGEAVAAFAKRTADRLQRARERQALRRAKPKGSA